MVSVRKSAYNVSKAIIDDPYFDDLYHVTRLQNFPLSIGGDVGDSLTVASYNHIAALYDPQR